MACQGFGTISREEKEEFLRRKMEDMKKKSEEILRRHAEVEADKRNADLLSDMVSTKIQTNLHSQPGNVVKNVKNTSYTQKEKSSEQIAEKKIPINPAEKQRNNRKLSEEIVHPAEKLRSSRQMPEENVHPAERLRSSRQISEENVHPAERLRSSRQISEEKCHVAEKLRNNRQVSEENVPPRRKEVEHRRQKLSEDAGPPPDPINYLSDPYRDGLSQDVDRSQDSRRHRSNYGGENFYNVKPVMQQRRNYERQHPPPPSSNSHLSMSVQMTGKERKEYENWKAERIKIDEERIARQKTSMGTWKREWDLNKTEQEEAAKRGEKQFYKQPRWISESGDYQEHNEKKNQGNRSRFNPSFDCKLDEKGDRSVMVNEHNTLTIVKNPEYEVEQALDSQYQKNQGGRKVFERKQNASINEERNFYNKKDINWKQNDQKVSSVSKGDGWENANVSTDTVKWDDDSSSKKDIHPLQQANSADREWRTGTKFNQRKNDPVHEVKVIDDNKYNKGNSNIDYHDNKCYIKRQKSLNSEDFHEGNSRQDKRFSSDKVQHLSDGRYNNSGRKFEDEWKSDSSWNKSRNEKSWKVADGLENDSGVNRVKDIRGRIISDGWEKEEGWNKMKENLQRSHSHGINDSFDNTYYDHRQKHFLSDRSKGGSFRGNNSRVYNSSERGKPYLENRKHENMNQRSFSSENHQFRGKEDKCLSDIDPQNIDRKWQYEGFDYKKGGGRSQFWEGNRRGNDQKKAHRSQGSRGHGRNAFGTNKIIAQSQEFYNKKPHFINSETSEISKPIIDLKVKTEISNDGWEYDLDSKFQKLSVKCIDGDHKATENPRKSDKVPVPNTIEKASYEPKKQQKSTSSVDAESHDDSWEDVTSESELSDPHDGITQISTDPLCIEKLHRPFEDDLAKSDNKKDNINQCSYDISDNIYPRKNSMTNEPQVMENINYCKEISDTNYSVIKEAQFTTHDESIERILEEIYNDTIKGIEQNVQEQSNTEVSNVCYFDTVSSKDDHISENAAKNGRCGESLVNSSLKSTLNDINDQSLQSFPDVNYVDINVDRNGDNAGADENDSIRETTVLSLDCMQSDVNSENSHNTSSLMLHTSGLHQADISDNKEDNSEDNCLQSHYSVCNDSAKSTNRDIDAITFNCSNKATVPFPIDAENVIIASSDALTISAIKPPVETSSNIQQKLNEVITESVKDFNDQSEVALDVEIQKIPELAATQIINNSNNQELLIIAQDKDTTNMFANVQSVCEYSIPSKNAETEEKDVEMASLSSKNILTNGNMSLESSENIKGMKGIDCSTEDIINAISDASTKSEVQKFDANSNDCQILHEVISRSTDILNEQCKQDSYIEVQQLNESTALHINRNSTGELPETAQEKNITNESACTVNNDSAVSERKKDVNGQDSEMLSSLQCTMASNNISLESKSTYEIIETKDIRKVDENTSTVSVLNVIKESNITHQESCEIVIKGTTEVANEEVQQMHETTASQNNKDSSDQEPEVIQDKNMTNKCPDAVDVYLPTSESEKDVEMLSLPSENTFAINSVSLDSTDRLKEIKDTDCNTENDTNKPSNKSKVSMMEPVEVNGNNNKQLYEEGIKECVTAFDEKSKADLCIEVEQMHELAETQINKGSRELTEAVSDKNSLVSACDNSVTYNSGEDVKMQFLSSEYTLASDNTSLEPIDKLRKAKGKKCCVEISHQVRPDLNNAVSSKDLPVVDKNTFNVQTGIQEKIVNDSEQIKEDSSASIINSDKANEQSLVGGFSLGLNNDSENTSHSIIIDTTHLRDPLTRTVRKISATESTTEFTEVLEVTTSIPQRIVMKDSDSIHILNKDEHSLNMKECEKICNSLNLDGRSPNNVLAE